MNTYEYLGDAFNIRNVVKKKKRYFILISLDFVLKYAFRMFKANQGCCIPVLQGYSGSPSGKRIRCMATEGLHRTVFCVENNEYLMKYTGTLSILPKGAVASAQSQC
jgi:hypothetical protein